MKKYIKNIIHYDESDIRIDRWLRRKFNSLPQSLIEKKLRKGLIKLNNKIVKSNKKIKENDLIEIFDYHEDNYSNKQLKKNIIKKIPDKIIQKFRSSIIFENDDYIILNKWKGIATQGGTKVLFSIDDIIKNLPETMNLVHRIDKETSGILIIAKNYRSTRFFGSMFKEKKIKKIYIALCLGIPKKSKGKIKLKTTNKTSKKNIKVKNDFSETIFELLESNNEFSLIAFMPITGKNHQIRIVAKNLGCPILGDNKYGIYKNKKNKYFQKLLLHSFGIEFISKDRRENYFAKFDDHTIDTFNQFKFKVPNEKKISHFFKKNLV